MSASCLPHGWEISFCGKETQLIKSKSMSTGWCAISSQLLKKKMNYTVLILNNIRSCKLLEIWGLLRKEKEDRERGLLTLGAFTIVKNVLMLKWKTTEMILYFNLSNWLLKKLGIGNEGSIEGNTNQESASWVNKPFLEYLKPHGKTSFQTDIRMKILT